MPLFQGYPAVISRLFGGQADPRLGPEANHQATQAGMLNAGLNTIMASGPGGMTPAAAIAAGILQGQGAAQQSREQTFRRRSQQQMAEIVAQPGPTQEVLTNMFKQAVSSGDVDAFRALSNVLPTVLATPRPATPRTQVVKVGDRQMLVDLNTGDEIRDLGPAPDDSFYERTITVNDPTSSTGRALVGIRRGSGEQVRIAEAPPVGGGTGGAAGRTNAVMARNARDAHERLVEVEQAMSGLGGAVAEMSASRPRGSIIGLGLNALTPEDSQRANAIALQWLAPTVRALSGAQMTEQEAGRYAAAFLVRGWDQPEAIEAKIQGRELLMQALEEGFLDPNKPGFRDGVADIVAGQGLLVLSDAEYDELRQGLRAGGGPAPGGGGGGGGDDEEGLEEFIRGPS